MDVSAICAPDEKEGIKGIDVNDLWGEQECRLIWGSWTNSGWDIDLQFWEGQDNFDLTEFSKASPIKVNKSVIFFGFYLYS